MVTCVNYHNRVVDIYKEKIKLGGGYVFFRRWVDKEVK